MTQNTLKNFISFAEKSPTAWHATHELKEHLLKKGFCRLRANTRWKITPGKRYFVQNGGTLCAFTLPKKMPDQATILGSHTDSPALKLKPQPVFFENGFPFCRLESYGGPILSTYLSRDLAIAGRLFTENKSKKILEKLVYLKKTPLVIPPLAIHLDRKVNTDPKPIDKQEHLCPLLGLSEKNIDEEKYFAKMLGLGSKGEDLLSFDLYLVPIDTPCFIGTSGAMLAAYRLDNLVSVYSSLEALCTAKGPLSNTIQMAIFFNHEEIGSQTEEGASSPFLGDCLKRICFALKMDQEDFFKLKSNSSLLSIDVDHGLHPLFKNSYDVSNTAELGEGVSIKFNANQSYATTGMSGAKIVHLCKKNRISYRLSASHSNRPSGSTIGPRAATHLGIETVDIGIPLLSMHSAREIIANKDYLHLTHLLKSALEG